MSETGKIHGLLAQAMREIGPMPKDGTAPKEVGAYPFRSIDGTRNKIHPVFAELGIVTAMEVLESRCEPAGKGFHTHQRIRFHMIADDGSEVCATSEGEAIDEYGGKDKGAMKAASYAEKMMYITLFALETGEGLDNEHHQEREDDDSPESVPQSTDEQSITWGMIKKRREDLNWTGVEMTAYIRARYPDGAFEEFTDTQKADIYEAMCKETPK